MNVQIEPSWKTILNQEFNKDYFVKLTDFVKKEYQSTSIYPAPKYIFRAFNELPLDKVKVVIIGQDPYHGPNQANGLCFAVNEGVDLPPSLINIYKEIESDLGKPIQKDGNLVNWARQGVLLLNATLTVRAHQAGSHQNKGWEDFTNAVIENLSQAKEGLVFMLWGAYAQKKGELIQGDTHLILTAPHPSPLSAHRGFFGCRHFSQANTFLMLKGDDPIEW